MTSTKIDITSDDNPSSATWNDDLQFDELFHPGRRLSLSKFKSQLYIHIREYYKLNDVEKPGKKGIALTVNRLKHLWSNIEEVDDALQQLKMGTPCSGEDGTVYKQHLGGGIYLSINQQYPGVDIRKFWRPSNCLSIAPSKTGIFIPISQWASLKDKLKDLYGKYPKLDFVETCLHQNQLAFLDCSECCPFNNLDSDYSAEI